MSETESVKRANKASKSDIITTFHVDHTSNKEIIARTQDCAPIVKEVEDIKAFSDGRGATSLGYFMGRIPGIIVEQYCKEFGISLGEFINDDIHVKRILNNPDYKKFRVFEGKM